MKDPNQYYNEQLLSKLIGYVPKKKDRLNLLTKILSLGKESAYRRLRGDIVFTFAEACVLTKHLQFSLDGIIDSKEIGKESSFKLDLRADDVINYMQKKNEQISGYYNLFSSISDLVIESVCPTIPHVFLSMYETLSKMIMFKLSFHFEQGICFERFEDLSIPYKLMDEQTDLARKTAFSHKNVLIISRNILSSFITEVNYFNHIGIISSEEKEKMKEELHNMMKMLENLSIKGETEDGMRSWIYISNVDLSFNYSYAKGKNFEQAYMDGIYMMDTIVSSDPFICKMHKKWIDSLKKYSTLISVSGQKERIEFFDYQKSVIDKM
jgi:hypothetical protein